MRPVDQTILGRGPEFNEPPGDCFAACIASILEVPLADVPNFCAEKAWYTALNLWLGPRGLYYVEVLVPDDAPYVRDWGFHVISGDGPRGCRHSIVGFGGKMVHDPHPSRAGLLAGSKEPKEFGLLVLTRPERLRGGAA